MPRARSVRGPHDELARGGEHGVPTDHFDPLPGQHVSGLGRRIELSATPASAIAPVKVAPRAAASVSTLDGMHPVNVHTPSILPF
jgi:hypothetical protein